MSLKYKTILLYLVILPLTPALFIGCQTAQVEDEVADEIDVRLEGLHLLTVTHLDPVNEQSKTERDRERAECSLPPRFEVTLLSSRKRYPEGLDTRRVSLWTGLNDEKETVLLSDSESPPMAALRDTVEGFGAFEITIGALITDGSLLSAKIDHYDPESGEGALSGEIAVAKDGLIVFHEKLEDLHFRHDEPILFQRAPEPFGHIATPVTGGPVHIYEGPDPEMFEKISMLIKGRGKRTDDTRAKNTQTLRVLQAWEGESYVPDLLREGIREKTYVRHFLIEYRHRIFQSGGIVTWTPSITIAKFEEREDRELYRLMSLQCSTPDIKAMVLSREDGRPVIGRLGLSGNILGVRVDDYASIAERGKISGEYICVNGGVVITYTGWENLPFKNGKWVHVGGISPELLDKIEHEEWERRREEFFSRRWWFW